MSKTVSPNINRESELASWNKISNKWQPGKRPHRSEAAILTLLDIEGPIFKPLSWQYMYRALCDSVNHYIINIFYSPYNGQFKLALWYHNWAKPHCTPGWKRWNGGLRTKGFWEANMKKSHSSFANGNMLGLTCFYWICGYQQKNVHFISGPWTNFDGPALLWERMRGLKP